MSNNTKTNWWSALLGLMVLVVVIWLLWSTFTYILTLQKEVAVAIVAAIATVLVAVFSLIITRQNEKRRDIEQQLRQQKTPLYEDFIMLFLRQIMKKTT